MKLQSLFAFAILGLGLMANAPTVSADPPAEPAPFGSCSQIGAPDCEPRGPEICTDNGCWRLYCNIYGCDLVHQPRPYFVPSEIEEP